MGTALYFSDLYGPLVKNLCPSVLSKSSLKLNNKQTGNKDILTRSLAESRSIVVDGLSS